MPYGPDETEQQQWARLWATMYQPSACWLATDNLGDRWLTDQFVAYNITGMESLFCYGSSYDVQWPDGPYKLVQAKGFKGMKDRDSIPEPDIEAYLEKMSKQSWYFTKPTEWSVAEHPGKAMLWACAQAPCLLGESTWTAIHRYYPGVAVAWAPNKGAGVFRFSVDGSVFGYAAGIRCPEGQEGIAQAIVDAITTSNRED